MTVARQVLKKTTKNFVQKTIFSKLGDELFNIESPVCFSVLAFGLTLILNGCGMGC